MTDEKTSAVHNTFVVERDFAHPPERVFQAFADPGNKKLWFKGPPGWTQGENKQDFRIGGRDVDVGGPPGEWTSRFDSLYYDIVPNRRIVYAYEMKCDDKRISVSLATIELAPSAKGTKFTLTEQGVFLDGSDTGQAREQGTRELIDALEKSLSL